LKHLKTHIIVGIICGICAILFSHLPIGELFELKGYDTLHLFKKSLDKPPPIVLVAIDEPSFAELNMQWPWQRRIHGKLINTLKASGAKVIALDILFVEPSNPIDDDALKRAIMDAGNVVLASDITVITEKQYTQKMVIEPIEIFSSYSKTALVSLPLDRDYVVRRIPPLRQGHRLFAQQIASLFIGRDLPLPINSYISYNIPPNSFTKVSYYQALEPHVYLPEGFFKDKIVIVGRAKMASVEPEKAQADYLVTPFFFISQSQEGIMSGMEIHGYIVNNFINGEFVRPLSPFYKSIFIILAGFIGSFLNINWRPLWTLLIITLTVAVYLGICLFVFETHRLWLPTFTMILAMTIPYGYFAINAYLVSESKKREIKRAFSHYISPSILESILKDPDSLKLGGKKVEATILFSDLAGFTSLSERLPPEEISHIINRYMTAMTKIILEHKGTIDKFIGDAIMAFWGAPIEDDSHAINACKSAVAMQKGMDRLREEFRAEGLPEISMRIGINTGIVIAGNMGSDELFDYTVIGDAVNLASRLESANKNFGTSIIISHFVYERARDFIITRPLGNINVKGKKEAIEVYELIDIIQQ